MADGWRNLYTLIRIVAIPFGISQYHFVKVRFGKNEYLIFVTNTTFILSIRKDIKANLFAFISENSDSPYCAGNYHIACMYLRTGAVIITTV